MFGVIFYHFNLIYVFNFCDELRFLELFDLFRNLQRQYFVFVKRHDISNGTSTSKVESCKFKLVSFN